MVIILSTSITLILIIIIIACTLSLFFVTPQAIKEYNEILINIKYTKNLSASLFNHLEELSRCIAHRRISQLLKLIHLEALNIKSHTHSKIYSKNAESILTWLNKFSIRTHIEDLRRLKYSSQIRFDDLNRDFKLMIPK